MYVGESVHKWGSALSDTGAVGSGATGHSFPSSVPAGVSSATTDTPLAIVTASACGPTLRGNRVTPSG